MKKTIRKLEYNIVLLLISAILATCTKEEKEYAYKNFFIPPELK